MDHPGRRRRHSRSPELSCSQWAGPAIHIFSENVARVKVGEEGRPDVEYLLQRRVDLGTVEGHQARCRTHGTVEYGVGGEGNEAA